MPPAQPLPISSPILWADPQRQQHFDQWLAQQARDHGLQTATLRSASSDASFRRYFRIDGASADGAASFIVMDAPPEHEDVRPFVHMAKLIYAAGLNAPRVLAEDVAHGFLLLSDLGSQLYLQALQTALAEGAAPVANALMQDATEALVQFQQNVPSEDLPPYDQALLQREVALFPEWCLQHELGVAWNSEELSTWQDATMMLVHSALAQPTVAVHRDFMPRNLMVCKPNPGILDFQDAVRGPITYDVASLLRDAFFSWDEEQEIDFAVRLWRVLAATRVDGFAASFESAGHFLPTETPRRQAEIQQRLAALFQLRAQGVIALQRAAAAVSPVGTVDGR